MDDASAGGAAEAVPGGAEPVDAPSDDALPVDALPVCRDALAVDARDDAGLEAAAVSPDGLAAVSAG